MSFLHLDFESCSEATLGGQKSVGLYNYATHPSTRVLMLAWAFDDEDPQLWQPHIGAMPARLADGIANPKQDLAAWNCAFERYIFKHVLKTELPAERWHDPQTSARYLSLPPSLEDVSDILGLPKNLTKDSDGSRLIKIFSNPTKAKKKKGQPQEPLYFRNWDTDFDDWQLFGNYCMQDVVAEREVQRRLTLLQVFPLPPQERKLWIFDQKVNDRGMPTDVQFVTNALALATRSKNEAIQKQNVLTGLANANSNTQMLKWAGENGYEPKSLRKGAVEAELKYGTTLTPLCRKVLEARKAASSTSYKKLAAILRNVSPDGRLRNQFVFMGSPRCSRWAGNAVQLHNMARPVEIFEDEENIDLARKLIYQMDYDGIMNAFGEKLLPGAEDKFGAVLLTVKSNIRTVFVAPPGKRFNVCDLASIETVVGAWVAGCQPLLNVFLEGRNAYIDFAVKMTQIPYDNLARDLNSKDPAIKSAAKRHRQLAKPAVLGSIYRMGGGKMSTTKDGDPYKTGLWGYAEGMGIEMTQAQSADITRVFRESYKEIPEFWLACEAAIMDVMKGTNTKRELGPNGCIKFDKITIQGRLPILRIQLPSGRFLHYVDAEIKLCKMPWEDREGKAVYREALVYGGVDQITKQWTRITSHGGKTFENIVQGFARDVLCVALLKIEYELEMETVGHVHDEAITLTNNDPFDPGVDAMVHSMSQPIHWAPGLPLGADGFEGFYYRK